MRVFKVLLFVNFPFSHMSRIIAH